MRFAAPNACFSITNSLYLAGSAVGSLPVVRVAGVDLVTPEYRTLNLLFPDDTAFLIARLARVCRGGIGESQADEIEGENHLCAFESGPAAVIYRPMAQFMRDETTGIVFIDADVLMLAFGNMRVEAFATVLARAKARVS